MGNPRNTGKYRLWQQGKLAPEHPYGIGTIYLTNRHLHGILAINRLYRAIPNEYK